MERLLVAQSGHSARTESPRRGLSRTVGSRPTPAYLRPFSGTFEPPAPGSAGAPLACFPLSIDSAEETAHDIRREAM